jgi:RNA polymerase sigma factor (TIGR02999 family)
VTTRHSAAASAGSLIQPTNRTLSSHDMTELLSAWSGGDQSAFGRMIEMAYPELRKIAQRCLGNERPEHTILATVLVHEAYIRLVDIHRMRWEDRAHFFAVSARIMRRILVDHARARHYAKRGGGFRRVDFSEALALSSDLGSEMVWIDEALEELAQLDPRKAQVVELRYFGGLTAIEIASVLGVSSQSVNRDWNFAKAWLARTMSHQERTGRSARRS